MHKSLFAVAFSLLSSVAFANCYVGVGMGKSELTKVPTKQNDRILASEYVDGHYTTNGSSQTKSLALGCTTPWDTAVELGYTSGLSARVDTHGRIVAPEYTDKGIPFDVYQRAEATMYTISAIKFVDVWQKAAVFGRLGAAHTKVRLDVKVPLGDGYSLVHTKTKGITSPYLGFGTAWRDKHWSVRLEERFFAKQLRETSLTLVYTF